MAEEILHAHKALWEKTRKVILPYDGGASQIHILSIPKKNIIATLKAISNSFDNPSVTLFTDESKMEIPLLELIKKNDLELFSQYGQITISCKLIYNVADLTFDFWIAGSEENFDLEMWFWADQFFINNTYDKERFGLLIELSRAFMELGGSKCILSPYEAGDPMEDLEKGHAIELMGISKIQNDPNLLG